ncbi:MAG TPA: MarR family winged helix-turn-helix transcriptional regulator [Rhizomicrobium sp.]|nr:MarR family winged helix-turn-helix transcriptional regulator [Rhizomicrobium sp.]
MQSDAETLAHARLDLDRFLPYRLSVLTNRVSNAIARHYSERFGLSIPEWRVMAVLGQSASLSAREVAERTAMDKVQVSRAVASLVERRRVQRDGDDDDGRVTRLSLTPRGRAIYDEIVPLALHLEAVLLAALTPGEREMLSALLEKLSGRISGLRAIEV